MESFGGAESIEGLCKAFKGVAWGYIPDCKASVKAPRGNSPAVMVTNSGDFSGTITGKP